MPKGALGLLAAYWPEGVFRYAYIPLQTLPEACVHRLAQHLADRPALVAGDEVLTYGALSAQVAEGAQALRARLPPGGRVALVLERPLTLVVWLLASLEGGGLVWPGGIWGTWEDLQAFSPDLVVADRPLPGLRWVSPSDLLEGPQTPASGERPDLRSPILALPNPWGGEVLHSHRTLVATALSWASFFEIEVGASVALGEPPRGWLGLSALLGTLVRGGTVYLVWPGAGPVPPEPVDYGVALLREALARPKGDWPGRARLGLLAGIEGPFRPLERRRLFRHLKTPILTVLGRNDLGPVLATHPSWPVVEGVGIPLTNVDLHPLNPVDGRPLAIGWDAVEEAEMGVRSPMIPLGVEVVEGWVRSRWMVAVDPSGLYFLRGRLTAR